MINGKTVLTFLVFFLGSMAAFAEGGRTDYDVDGNGLIEINDLEDLNEIRNNTYYNSGYLFGTTLYGQSMGCPAGGCFGFELTQDLDFDTNTDGVMDEQDAYWNEGEGWFPISGQAGMLNTRFAGNGHVIYNLYINRPQTTHVGLFSFVKSVEVSNLGFAGSLMFVAGSDYVGAFAGAMSSGALTGLFNTGSISGADRVGGLVGHTYKTEIKTAFNTGAITGEQYVGGLVGYFYTSSVMRYVYSTGRITSTGLGGALAGSGGRNSTSKIYRSYFPLDSTGAQESVYNAQRINSKTVQSIVDLQCTILHEGAYVPVSCDGTNYLYNGWDYLDYYNSDGEPVFYWDFGETNQLPGLNFNGVVYRDSDGDGSLDAQDDYPFDTDNDGVDNSFDMYPLDYDRQ
ncbi:hypothetical protein [Teredinibacter franksiae]|mgnify:CR=1 FL=1|uniref:hypothetical protein n=1 Tax=Teredinibacter franksiae TaxID=2761453 RepID=UPI0016289F49|nr:hypothetical protein [Teredinibacter franksiae]